MNYSNSYLKEVAAKKILYNEYEKSIAWQCPSNIALIKYWGKRGNQIPLNPSISFTLNESVTNTRVVYHYDQNRIKYQLEYYFEHKRNEKFENRISLYLESLQGYLPFINGLNLTIHSENSFPHSAGIASSASSFGALALCLVSIEEELTGAGESEKEFKNKASFLARLGSGSACRSIFGNLVEWGKSNFIADSSDEIAIQIINKNNNVFNDFQDIILIIDETGKPVSSSKGHALMIDNPYKRDRLRQAKSNLSRLLNSIDNNDLHSFTEIVENEALSLHALMLASNPGFFLIKQATIEVIERIRKFRQDTNIPVAFTLDAGANVHVLFPLSFINQVLPFVKSQLVQYCSHGKFIHDWIGEGPLKLM